jgi:diguanylate cyclase (GGDEF)-like protein/PAS domain S-box-containing protein
MSEYRKGSDRQAAGRSDQLIGITQIIGRPWALALMALLSCWWLSVAVGAQAITPDDAGDRFYWGYFVGGGLLLAGLFGIPVVMLAGQRRQLMLERERLSDRLFALTTRQQELEAEIERQRQGAARQRGLEIEIEQLRRAGREFEAEIERLRQRTARQRELEAETQRLRQGTARQRELEIEAEQLRQNLAGKQKLEAETERLRQDLACHWELEVEVEQLRKEAASQRQLEEEIRRLRQNLETLRDSEQRFRTLTQQLPVGIFMADLQGQCRYVNERWYQMTGLAAEQTVGLPWTHALHPDDRDQVEKIWRQALDKGSEFVVDHRFQTPTGRDVWMDTRAVPLRDRSGQIVYYLGANTDIAELKRTEETLRASEARFRSYFELPLVGIALTGPDKRWWEVNNRLCEMLGYRRSQLLQLTWAELTYPEDLATDLAQFERVASRRIDGYSIDKRFMRQDGSLLYASVSTRCIRRSNGMVDYYVALIQDISERKQAEEHIQHLAHYDALTDLPNRTLLGDRLQQVLLRAARDHTQVGILLVDLDHFKRINDTLDHTVGDQLLREVGHRLQSCVRECDTISRQGGDEFAVVLPDLINNDEAPRIAERILGAMTEPYRFSDHDLHITCSIGISLYPRDGRSAEILLKNADNALYRAKDLGRNNYQFYQSGATMVARERLTLENSLRYAVDRQQLELYYQPKWDFHANAITGAEALIRWNHPQLGLLPPARFIPIAEDSGLVLALGEWVLRAAVQEIGQLHQNGASGLRVAVNVSARQFHQGNLTTLVQGLLTESGFDPGSLELELTEGILMHHTEDNITALKSFKAMGVRLAIDDFGTGYSSLGYLQRFPVDVLKIDRSFVTELPSNESNVAIVDAIVTLAHGLGLLVVAEGVETVEHVEFLRAHGCDEGQGYYFGRPVPLLEFQSLLMRDRARLAGEALSAVSP